MTPYRVGSRELMDEVRGRKGVEPGPQPVRDEAVNRARRAELIGSLPDRLDAGVIEDFGAEHVLYAGARQAFPAFAAPAALGLFALGMLSWFL